MMVAPPNTSIPLISKIIKSCIEQYSFIAPYSKVLFPLYVPHWYIVIIIKNYRSGNDVWQYHCVWGYRGSHQPTQWRLSTTIPNKVILPYSIPHEHSFVFISYMLLVLFQWTCLKLKCMRENKYFGVYFIFNDAMYEYIQLWHKFHQNNAIMHTIICHNDFSMSEYAPLWCHDSITLFCDDRGVLSLFRTYCW